MDSLPISRPDRSQSKSTADVGVEGLERGGTPTSGTFKKKLCTINRAGAE